MVVLSFQSPVEDSHLKMICLRCCISATPLSGVLDLNLLFLLIGARGSFSFVSVLCVQNWAHFKGVSANLLFMLCLPYFCIIT